jgi:chromosome segregation ATPase
MSQDESSLIIVRIKRLEALLDGLDVGTDESLGGRLATLIYRVDELENSTRGLNVFLDSRIECVQAAEINRLEAGLAGLKDRLVEKTGKVQGEAEMNWRRLEEECAELRRDLDFLRESFERQAADLLEASQRLSQDLGERAVQAEELEAEVRSLRQKLSVKDEQLQFFADRHQNDDARIGALWAEINRLRAELAQVAQAAVNPSLVDQFLGCMLGLAIMSGLGWLAFKMVVWLYGLIR